MLKFPHHYRLSTFSDSTLSALNDSITKLAHSHCPARYFNPSAFFCSNPLRSPSAPAKSPLLPFLSTLNTGCCEGCCCLAVHESLPITAPQDVIDASSELSSSFPGTATLRLWFPTGKIHWALHRWAPAQDHVCHAHCDTHRSSVLELLRLPHIAPGSHTLGFAALCHSIPTRLYRQLYDKHALLHSGLSQTSGLPVHVAKLHELQSAGCQDLKAHCSASAAHAQPTSDLTQADSTAARQQSQVYWLHDE